MRCVFPWHPGERRICSPPHQNSRYNVFNMTVNTFCHATFKNNTFVFFFESLPLKLCSMLSIAQQCVVTCHSLLLSGPWCLFQKANFNSTNTNCSAVVCGPLDIRCRSELIQQIVNAGTEKCFFFFLHGAWCIWCTAKVKQTHTLTVRTEITILPVVTLSSHVLCFFFFSWHSK